MYCYFCLQDKQDRFSQWFSAIPNYSYVVLTQPEKSISMLNCIVIYKKSCKRETPNLSTDADSSTAAKKLLSISFFLHPPLIYFTATVAGAKGLLGQKKINKKI